MRAGPSQIRTARPVQERLGGAHVQPGLFLHADEALPPLMAAAHTAREESGRGESLLQAWHAHTSEDGAMDLTVRLMRER